MSLMSHAAKERRRKRIAAVFGRAKASAGLTTSKLKGFNPLHRGL
ncbi:hypothetical protein [Acidocella sp.]|nr:hypothetical protein [Acidocella sp.]